MLAVCILGWYRICKLHIIDITRASNTKSFYSQGTSNTRSFYSPCASNSFIQYISNTICINYPILTWEISEEKCENRNIFLKRNNIWIFNFLEKKFYKHLLKKKSKKKKISWTLWTPVNKDDNRCGMSTLLGASARSHKACLSRASLPEHHGHRRDTWILNRKSTHSDRMLQWLSLLADRLLRQTMQMQMSRVSITMCSQWRLSLGSPCPVMDVQV